MKIDATKIALPTILLAQYARAWLVWKLTALQLAYKVRTYNHLQIKSCGRALLITVSQIFVA